MNKTVVSIEPEIKILNINEIPRDWQTHLVQLK
jgi:hypothetical protein